MKVKKITQVSVDNSDSRAFYCKKFGPLAHTSKSAKLVNIYFKWRSVFYSSAHARDYPTYTFGWVEYLSLIFTLIRLSWHLSQSLPRLSPHQSSSLNNTTVPLLSSIRHTTHFALEHSMSISAGSVSPTFIVRLYTLLSRLNLFSCVYYPPGNPAKKHLQRFRRRRFKKIFISTSFLQNSNLLKDYADKLHKEQLIFASALHFSAIKKINFKN